MRLSAHISWLFGELPYLERAGAARAAGFELIESAWPEDERDRAGLPGAVAEQRSAAPGFAVALLNCPAGDIARGERGFVNDGSRRGEAESAFAQTVELAGAIGARRLNLLVGRALPGVPIARQRSAVIAALRAFAPVAGRAGLEIVLEPLNSIESPGFLAPTPEAAVELIEAAGEDRVGLLLDVYHLARAGADPVAAIGRHAERIGHVQLSDCPGRGAPGSGALDFRRILEALGACGYDGALGLEYQPRGASEQTLAWTRDREIAALLD